MTQVTAAFVKSSPSVSACPDNGLPEFAFIGRSNVGKSSLVNMLTRRKGLAKISATPGKTLLINHYLVNDQWYLVDLPGYGFARIPKKEREALRNRIRGYILKRRTLVCTFLLVDARLEPQKSDLEFMEWMAESGKPFVLLFTKTDKVSAAALRQCTALYRKELEQNWEGLPLLILTSATTGKGRDEVFAAIREMMPAHQ
jgi:GTP-binding protein